MLSAQISNSEEPANFTVQCGPDIQLMELPTTTNKEHLTTTETASVFPQAQTDDSSSLISFFSPTQRHTAESMTSKGHISPYYTPASRDSEVSVSRASPPPMTTEVTSDTALTSLSSPMIITPKATTPTSPLWDIPSLPTAQYHHTHTATSSIAALTTDEQSPRPSSLPQDNTNPSGEESTSQTSRDKITQEDLLASKEFSTASHISRLSHQSTTNIYNATTILV